MKCSKCRFENRAGAKFCKKCGDKLELVCPSCGHAYEPDSTFCDECGYSLTLLPRQTPKDLSLDEKLNKIQRYLPKGLTEKILSQRDKIEGERKQVTVMFCDMEGFTAFSEKLGPEEAYSVMDQVYEILIHKVHDHEGTINEMTGDGIMALFGAPVALEDAPQRAIQSAHAIHREMTRFSDSLKQENKVIQPLRMRIGIHTGPVVVGTLGNDLRVEFKAVGDTVNIASRMEGLAEPGSTYITEETFRATEGFFRFEALGERKVKGKQEPVNVYRVIAPSTRRTRFDVSAERGLTPLVGRDRELELLMDGFERCKEGRGQAFSIMAEAGLGKSRLLYEFRKSITNEDVTFLEGKCLSYSRGVAYYPVIDVLKSNFDIREGERDFEIRQKVMKGIESIQADEASTLPYLFELLLVKNGGIDQTSMSPEMRKARTLDALTRIVLKASEIRPLIMAIEDLHWIDKSSEESLKQLLESISGARVLLIFTYRPEFVHTWGARSYHSQLTLNRLSNRESLLMVTHLLGVNELTPDLELLILDKTEGVPFFIEEFIKSLKNLKIITRKERKYELVKDVQNLAIPITIQDVIMARVDSLPEESKEVLQKGSIIEREFDYQLIQRVARLPDRELLSYLSVLKDSELLYERGIYPESTYIFKHALTREVVYGSILTKRKKGLHEETGQAIEEIYSDRLEEFCEMLAHHYSKSENPEKAYKYLKLSGNKAANNYSNSEAFRFYKQAINMLNKMPEDEEIKKEQIEILLLAAFPISALGYPEDSLEILHTGETLSKELGDEKSLSKFLSQLGLYYSYKEGDILHGIKYCEESFKEAEKIHDIELMATTGMELVMSYWLPGECVKIIDVASKVIALLDKAQRQSESYGRPYNVYSMLQSFCAASKDLLGNFEEGKALFEKGLDFALEIKDFFALSMLELHHGMQQNIKGDAKNAMEHLKNSIRYSEEGQISIILPVGWIGLGWAYELLGELKTAREYMEKGLKMHSELGLAYHTSVYYALLSMVHFDEGDLENAQHRAEEALKLSQKNHEKWPEGFALTVLGRILGKAGMSRDDKAEECILQGIKILDELKLKTYGSVGYFFLGELYANKGRPEKALETLKKAKALYKDMGMDYWLAKTQEVLNKS